MIRVSLCKEGSVTCQGSAQERMSHLSSNDDIPDAAAGRLIRVFLVLAIGRWPWEVSLSKVILVDRVLRERAIFGAVHGLVRIAASLAYLACVFIMPVGLAFFERFVFGRP